MAGSAYYMRQDELVDVVGEAAALRLMAAMGGTRFYVRQKISPESPIVAAVGLEAAQILADHIATGIGGLAVDIPRGPTGQMAEYRRRLLAMADKPDMTAASIARELGIHSRTVHRARAKLRSDEEDEQGRLF